VDNGSDADGADLDRLRDLCDGFAGRVGNGELQAWASAGDSSAVGDEVFAVVRDAGLLGEGDPAPLVVLPADGDALLSRMWEVDESEAIDLLTSLAASTRSNRPRRHGLLRRAYEEQPQDVFAEMARLIGSGTRWWTNTDLSRWSTITQHNFDAVIVGAGNGIILTVIAFEGGG
jgi:hypothetical protein